MLFAQKDHSGQQRGSFRGSRASAVHRGRGGFWRRPPPHTPSSNSLIGQPLGELISSIDLNTFRSDPTLLEDAKITECDFAASYSWTDKSAPEIIIPGQPPVWAPRELPCKLPPDDGVYLRDQNGAHCPDYPLQASVQSLFALDETFDPGSVDILGCASTLGEIFRFSRSVKSDFRFDVEMVGNTLFLVRNCKRDVIPDVLGYGHSFLQEFLSLDNEEIKGSESHQRIIRYSLGGFKFLVRFECDGYLSDRKSTTTKQIPNKATTDSVDTGAKKISTKVGGNILAQDSLIEIKTKGIVRRPVDLTEHLPRLWLRQIPTLMAGYHSRGEFQDIERVDVQQLFSSWETIHKSEIAKFSWVLGQIKLKLEQDPERKLELCRSGLGPLEIRERTGEQRSRDVLPQYWKAKWMGQSECEDATTSSSTSFINTGPNPSSDSDESDDEHYPRFDDETSRGGSEAVSHESSDEDDFSLDYTACDGACGYCGRCA